ncbi:zinc finger domain-containing protein [Mycobacterium camsae]|uniref:zinc finger domain-containing protein n=1 Tax=Mycobacterium gordonae TaxID=1778 RepID=UPI0019812B2C|nr:hypothetical protein [Mycobacterium gordonae]
MRSKTEHPSLTHRCPFCGADPGTPCVTRNGGRELDWPHSRRIHFAEPKPQRPKRQALCCVCGHPRTVSGNYFFGSNDENRASGGFGDDPRGWLNTGTLKCVACGCRTRHALLRDPGSAHVDYAEAYQRYALGGQWPDRPEYAPDRERLRERYFRQFPRNPNLRHLWWVQDGDKARAAGIREVPTLCGGVHTLRGESTAARQVIKPQYLAPEPVHTDQYTDHATGESWRDGDCVDCLRVYNDGLLQRTRDDLARLIRWYFVRSDRLDAAEVEELRSFLRASARRTWQRWQQRQDR